MPLRNDLKVQNCSKSTMSWKFRLWSGNDIFIILNDNYYCNHFCVYSKGYEYNVECIVNFEKNPLWQTLIIIVFFPPRYRFVLQICTILNNIEYLNSAARSLLQKYANNRLKIQLNCRTWSPWHLTKLSWQ